MKTLSDNQVLNIAGLVTSMMNNCCMDLDPNEDEELIRVIKKLEKAKQVRVITFSNTPIIRIFPIRKN